MLPIGRLSFFAIAVAILPTLALAQVYNAPHHDVDRILQAKGEVTTIWGIPFTTQNNNVSVRTASKYQYVSTTKTLFLPGQPKDKPLVHEVAHTVLHQLFPNVVKSPNGAWLDEGFARLSERLDLRKYGHVKISPRELIQNYDALEPTHRGELQNTAAILLANYIKKELGGDYKKFISNLRSKGLAYVNTKVASYSWEPAKQPRVEAVSRNYQQPGGT